MAILVPLSRSAQLRLNGRAVFRDVINRDFQKFAFHSRGLWRALVSPGEISARFFNATGRLAPRHKKGVTEWVTPQAKRNSGRISGVGV